MKLSPICKKPFFDTVRFFFLLFSFLFCSQGFSLKNGELPKNLLKTYHELIIAIQEKNREKIVSLCLPSTINVTDSLLGGVAQNEINLKKISFQKIPQIIYHSEKEKGTFFIRTASAYFNFVETNDCGFLLYRFCFDPLKGTPR